MPAWFLGLLEFCGKIFPEFKVIWDNWVPVTSKMATDVEAVVARMRREVETLRESERKVRNFLRLFLLRFVVS